MSASERVKALDLLTKQNCTGNVVEVPPPPRQKASNYERPRFGSETGETRQKRNGRNLPAPAQVSPPVVVAALSANDDAGQNLNSPESNLKREREEARAACPQISLSSPAIS